MVFIRAYPNSNPKARPSVRIRVTVTSKIQDFLIQIGFKDETLKVFAKTNLLHLVSNVSR